MQLYHPPSSQCELERNAASILLTVRDNSVTAFPSQTELHACESSLEDLLVLERIQSQAMAWLYEKYAGFIYSFSFRILRDPEEAQDVLQEVFLRIWRSPEQLKIGKNLFPWIAVVCRNCSIDIIRRRHPSESIEDMSLLSNHDTARQAEQNMMSERARALMDALPLEQRAALEMAYWSEMTHSEIADKTGKPLGTVKSRIRGALKNLRMNLQPNSCASRPSSRNARLGP